MKNKIAFILTFILVFVQIIPAYAAVATGSNVSVASSSNAAEIIEEEIEIDDYDVMYDSLLSFSNVPVASASDADYGIMLLGSETPNIQSVTNTVDYSDVRFEISYVDQYDSVRYVGDGLDNTGYARVNKPSDFTSMVRYSIRIGKESLPSTGNYKIEVGYRGDAGGVLNPYAVSLMYGDSYKNAVTLYPASEKIYDFDYYMGDIYFAYNVQITGDDLIVFFYSADTVLWPFAGTWNIRFTKLAPDVATDFENPYYSSSEIQDSIADSSIQISENTASIADSLKELIVHISDQLAALWDQMYNLMHVPQLANDDKNTQLIVDTLQDGLSVEIENQDDNTEEILHGYDQSGIDDANDSLNSSIAEYSEAEKDVLDSVNENLNDFEFEESFDAYVSTIGTVSDFLQRMYESSGSLKDVINIGFFLSIAGIVIGLYRFKEG